MDKSDIFLVSLEAEAKKRGKRLSEFWQPIFRQIMIDSYSEVKKAEGYMSAENVVWAANIASSRMMDFIELANKKALEDNLF